ncbi:MAG TPA: ABC transporter permease [Ohtaekwangia sp.]|uniref:ABC transporter permease n=1 Tax=Ohtaekwangia sp. TaxID=2066019 RepID=UPI002F924757
MLKNYITAAFRNLYKNKGFSAINILGLSVGLASFVLITLYVYHELSMDRFNTKADRIYRIVENLRTENELLLQSTSSPPMGPKLVQEFPEVQSFVRFLETGLLVKKDNVSFYEDECYLADSSVFDIFTFPLLKGNAKTALTEPNTTVLTEKTARKYFGDQDPVGQSLEMDGEQYKITGIMADVPENAHFTFDILVSFSSWSTHNKENEMRAWYWNSFHTYILLKEANQIESLRAKMPGFIERNIDKGGMYYEDLPLQSLTSIYLETPRSWENGKRGSINNLYILSVIAIFILLIACFNYVNLATARASRRLKEVGLRKVLGAQRRMLIAQFLGESIIVSSIATIMGFSLAWMVLPVFNTLVEASLGFAIVPHTYYIWGSLIVLAIFLGLLSGSYPAFMISGFDPLQIFRPSLRGIFSHQYFRKILVSAQFVISITLVAGTLLISDQLSHLRTQSLGFRKEATLKLQTGGDHTIREHLESVRSELLKIQGVTSVTASHTVPGESTTNLYSQLEMQDGKMSPTNINTNFVDHDFIPGFGIEMLAGRNFSRDFKADDTTAFIINETAMKDFGWTPQNSIGKKVHQNGKNGTIIGVTKDFHYRSLHHKIEPLMLTINPWAYNKFSVKISSNNIPSVVEKIEKQWKALAPGLPFRYSFLEDDYNNLYKADAQLGKVASVFSSLAIFVGCLGLLGLTSFSVERRVKEIGIRKVLGASVGNMIYMISKEFVGLIVISFIVAVPITYYLITRWLENFTDRINIGPVTFVIAGISVLAVAWLTVSFLSFKAASANPSKSLRSE